MIIRDGSGASAGLVSKDLASRIGIAAVGIPLLICVFWFGGIPLLIFLGLVSALGTWEYGRILKGRELFSSLPDILLSLFIFLCVARPEFLPSSPLWQILILVLLILPRAFIQDNAPFVLSGWKTYLVTVLGWIYIGVLPGLLYRLGAEFLDLKLVLALLILIWITDSAAYFIGLKFGRKRGIFPVSPNKSLEGFIAGVTAPFVVCAILVLSRTVWSTRQLLLLALCAGVFGQLGDLLESKLKRLGGVKDSSNVIPGHGGVLDRFDSLLIAGPVLYFLLKIIP